MDVSQCAFRIVSKSWWTSYRATSLFTWIFHLKNLFNSSHSDVSSSRWPLFLPLSICSSGIHRQLVQIKCLIFTARMEFRFLLQLSFETMWSQGTFNIYLLYTYTLWIIERKLSILFGFGKAVLSIFPSGSSSTGFTDRICLQSAFCVFCFPSLQIDILW